MRNQDIILKVENISKQYRLGVISTGTISHDLNRWWHKVRGKEDPFLKIGETNNRATKGESDYVWALKDINFEVERGEVLGIIGKNGAGKSTLLKILSRVTGPTTGSIKSAGRIASLLEVGTGFHPELTGKENIFLNGAILGMTKAEIRSKLDEIIEFSGCERYVDTPVKRYSSGMRVRLAFAVAAFLEPDILVVDEVLAVGDAEFQKKAIGKMQDISTGDGKTVLFVSHNMASVKSLCSTGIILENGMIKYRGTAEDAVGEYLKGESTNSDVLLKERRDREGNGKLRIVDVKLKNDQKDIVTDVISGEPINVELEYEKEDDFSIKNLVLVLNFKDRDQNNVLTIISDEMLNPLELINDKGLINVKFDNLNLRGESYSLRILAFNERTGPDNKLDGVENAAIINVLPGDIYKTGKVQRKGYSALARVQISIN